LDLNAVFTVYTYARKRFYCFESHEQFFSYLATVTITDDGAANLVLCLALAAFSSEGSFTCHTYCDTGPPLLRSCRKDPWFSLLNAVLLAKEQPLPILNVLGLTRLIRYARACSIYNQFLIRGSLLTNKLISHAGVSSTVSFTGSFPHTTFLWATVQYDSYQ
jgi:hypothetical protein